MSKEKTKIEATIGKKYDIKSQISAGGMGKIYLGIHRSLNKRVAVKIIHQEFRKDETFRKRFHREARLAANLDHPGIVDIYDFGSSENFDYIIMPFIDGETLKEKLKREKRLPISKSLDLIAAITSALSFAHNNNVVHRDIKPSNILIDKQERAYLTDFGISKDLGDVDLTLPDTVMGSPRYISPEQITGKKIDGRCDLYALGLIFYEMVTGSYPYADRNANAVYYAQVNEVPQRPDQINPDIPGTVSDIIMKLIEKLPDNRYQKGSQILQDIANAKSGLPPVQSSEAEPHIEVKPAIIDHGSIDDKENDDNGDHDDQPTVINVSIADRGQIFDNQQIVVESTDSGEKSKPIRFSPRRLTFFGSGFVLCVIIGYFLLYNPSPQTDMLVIAGNESVTLPGKSSSMDEKHSSHSPSLTQPMQKEAPIEKSEPIPTKSSPDSSEVSLSAIAPKQPTEKVSLVSLTDQLKAFEESQDAKFLQMWTKKNVYKIGDSIGYHFQSSQDCHLTVILFSSSGEIIQVFPNRYHPDSFISTGNTYNIPSPESDIKLEVTGPPGIEKLLALASDKPLEILPLNTEDLPFFVMDGTDPTLLKQIHDNLQLAKKMSLKHKSVQYAIAK
jgi:serine/threonine protein kinase